MLQEILNALKGTDALGDMISELGQMLRAARWMFDKSSEVLMRRVDWQGLAKELYEHDRRINQIELTIREQVITHLSVGNEADLGACLILMSVVKDAERIGDYCKNIFEVGRFYQHDYTCRTFREPLEDIRTSLVPLFEHVEKAFLEADRPLARHVLDAAGSLTRSCDLLVRQLLSTGTELSADEAVAYVLLARFYKRVTAHLGNIASSVVSPVPLIDYRTTTSPSEP